MYNPDCPEFKKDKEDLSFWRERIDDAEETIRYANMMIQKISANILSRVIRQDYNGNSEDNQQD